VTSLFDKFRKKPEAEPAAFPGAPPPEQKKSTRGLNIRVLVMPLLITGVAVLVAAAAITYFQFALQGHERRDAQIHGRADRIADHLAGRLRGYTDVIAAAGRSPAVVAAMTANDPLRWRNTPPACASCSLRCCVYALSPGATNVWTRMPCRP
jgi:hypothetical protein